MDTDLEHKLMPGKISEEYTEWECSVCDRQVRLTKDGDLKILNKGDQSVKHILEKTPVFALKNATIETPTVH